MRRKGSHRRAFVLELNPLSGEQFVGRVEHVASGRSARFATPEELRAFVLEVLTTDADSTGEAELESTNSL